MVQLNGVWCMHKPSGPTCQQFINAIKRTLLENNTDINQLQASPPQQSSFRFNVRLPANMPSHLLPKSLRPPPLDSTSRACSIPLGHGGTLDAMAEGVLPLGIGKGTRSLSALLTNCVKAYAVQVTLGIATDTLDKTGTITNKESIQWKTLKLHDFQQMADSFIPGYDQVPPVYSALKKNGIRFSDLARRSTEHPSRSLTCGNVPMSRPVSLEKVNVLSFSGDGILEMTLTCGSGFYVRSFVRDLTQKLNTFGTMSKLVRIAHGPFALPELNTTELPLLATSETELSRASTTDPGSLYWDGEPLEKMQRASFLRMEDLKDLKRVQEALYNGSRLVNLYERRHHSSYISKDT